MDWIDLSQDRDQWRALVNMVIKLLSSIKFWEVLEWLHNWQILKEDSAPGLNSIWMLLLTDINSV
jgi:hypothetical protein